MAFMIRALFLFVFLLITPQAKAQSFRDLLNSTFAITETSAIINTSFTTGHAGTARNLGSACNYFQGKWIFDSSYPLYDYSTCPFIDSQFDCLRHGRPDKMYLKYRWQPFSCNIPRFNGLSFLERMRGKKIMFVGDSLSLNQWQSLACLIHASVPNSKYSLVRGNGLASLVFLDYDVTIKLFRTTFLVDLVTGKAGRILKLDTISNGNAWNGMDMLIFNTWHWWTHTGRTQPWDYMQEGNTLYKDMNRLIAFYKALTTWGRWINRNIDPSKTKVFYQGVSPVHYEGKDWNEPSKTCSGQTQPFFGRKYPAGIPMASVVVNKVLSRIKQPVYLLDITTLSQYRKDGHPTFYGGDHSGLDCSHWCLPGLPDTWNQLLYTAIVS